MKRYVFLIAVLAGCPAREVSRLDPTPVVIRHVDSPLELNNDVDLPRAFTNPGNTGFLRDTAHLAVVILADEDDCSVTSNAAFSDPSLGRLDDDYRCFVGGVTCDEDAFAPGPHHNCHPRDPSPYLHTP